MTPAFKAALAFLKLYPTITLKMTDATLTDCISKWWEVNKKDYPRATFEDFKASVLSTIEYNKANPLRK